MKTESPTELLSDLRNRDYEVYLDDSGIEINIARNTGIDQKDVRKLKACSNEISCLLNQEEELKKLVRLMCQEVFGITSLDEKESRVCAALQCVNESLSYYTKLAMDHQLYKHVPL